MGLLRTIFAISVVFFHSNGHFLIGGRNAVQLFYMISGFLISYVLIDNINYKNKIDFYINRVLRLYPIYLAVSLMTLFILIIQYVFFNTPTLFKTWIESPFSAKILLIFSNIFIFGQDLVMFSGVQNGQLVLTNNFYKSDILLFEGLLVPQAWTLGLELSFYLIAPFILISKKAIYGMLVFSIGFRILLIWDGIGTHDPWTYRFFPLEISLFLLGALAHQILYPIYKKFLKEKINLISKLATWFLVLFSLTFFQIPAPLLYKNIILFVSFFMLMPLTFIFSINRNWDKKIGDLSYPIYIGHILVIMIFIDVINFFDIYNKELISIACVFLSIIFALLLDKYISNPIEIIRSKFRTLIS